MDPNDIDDDDSSETDDSYDEDIEDVVDDDDSKDGTWDNFFQQFRKDAEQLSTTNGSETPRKNFEPTTPLLESESDKQVASKEVSLLISDATTSQDAATSATSKSTATIVPSPLTKESKKAEKKSEKKEEKKEGKKDDKKEDKRVETERSDSTEKKPEVKETKKDEKKDEKKSDKKSEKKDSAADLRRKSTEKIASSAGGAASSPERSKRKERRLSFKAPGIISKSRKASLHNISSDSVQLSPKDRPDSPLIDADLSTTEEENSTNSSGDSLETSSSGIQSGLIQTEDDKNKLMKKSILNRLISKKTSSGINRSDQRKAAVKIQAVWRGYSFRKKLKQVTGTRSSLLKRLIALRQIVDVETAYVSNLCIIIENYLKPLIEYNKYNEEARKALPIQVIKAIFRNIESIYNLHVNFLKDLETRVDQWPFVDDIPALFLKATGSFAIYGRYAEEAASSEETLRFYKQKQPLSTFLTKMYNERLHQANLPPRANLPDLYALLVLPYRHLGKLHVAFAHYLYTTNASDEPDYDLLANAVAILGQLKKFIWNKAEEGISLRKMSILKNKIQASEQLLSSKPRVIRLNPNQPITQETLSQSDAPSSTSSSSSKRKRTGSSSSSSSSSSKKKRPSKKERIKESKERERIATQAGRVAGEESAQTSSSLDSSGSKTSAAAAAVRFLADLEKSNDRKLVRNGAIAVGGSKRNVFLFTDMCLILEVVSIQSSRFEAMFPLRSASVQAKSVSLANNSQTFQVKTPTEIFVFTEKLQDQEQLLEQDSTWMQAFEDLIALSNDHIFGAPLNQVIEREHSVIPTVVLNIIHYLNKNITNSELFRSTMVNAKSVQSLRDPTAHRKLNNSSLQDVVGLLILYFEQLPDTLLEFVRTDPIFTAQTAPNEEALLAWTRRSIDALDISQKNLLEYLMSFLSKVLSRSESNGVTSIDLAVIFSPLIFKPKELTLEYCFKMARVVRLIQIIIEHASELFKTSDDTSKGSNSLPTSLEEFFVSDQFGPWWRDFRQKKTYFIEYVSQKHVIDELVHHILRVPDQEDTDEQRRLAQFASLAYGIMVNDGVVSAIFADIELLAIVLRQFNGQLVSERANKHFCDFVEVLLRGNPEAMAAFIEDNPEMNQQIVSSIGSGNFCNMILSVAETWQMREHIHRIVVHWGVAALHQLLTSSDTSQSDTLANTVRFLRFLVRTTQFMQSEISAPFAELLNTPSFLIKLIDRSLDAEDIDSCVCIIPLVIEILVQNKNKNPTRSPLDALLNSARDSNEISEKRDFADSVSEAERQLREKMKAEVPMIISTLIDRHEMIVALLRDQLYPFYSESNTPNQSIAAAKYHTASGETPPPSLGFFRFGLIKLIQAILVTNYPHGNMVMAETDLIGVCLDLFFFHYRHSILHSVIAYIVRYIMAMGNHQLISLLILRLKLPDRIVSVFENADSGNLADVDMLDNLRGYLKMIAVAIRNSSVSEEMLAGNVRWNRFVSDVLLRDDSNSKLPNNTQAEVALAQKKIARSNLTKQEFTDQLEDKISQ